MPLIGSKKAITANASLSSVVVPPVNQTHVQSSEYAVLSTNYTPVLFGNMSRLAPDLCCAFNFILTENRILLQQGSLYYTLYTTFVDDYGVIRIKPPDNGSVFSLIAYNRSNYTASYYCSVGSSDVFPNFVNPISRVVNYGDFYSALKTSSAVLDSVDIFNVVNATDNYVAYTFTVLNGGDIDILYLCLRGVFDYSGTATFSLDSSSRSAFNSSLTQVFANVNSSSYISGYDNGYSVGKSESVKFSYDNGYNIGYEEGYQTGIDTTLSDITPWDAIVSGVNSFLRIEILPNVSMWVLLSVGFGLILLGFAVKVFLGG